MRLLIPVMILSAFMNNTPVVAILIPLTINWSRRTGLSKVTASPGSAYNDVINGMLLV
jgi:Na+/H+ antiporter NhaD/arsenite permease-like protein